MTSKAQKVIRAAQNRKNWGEWTTKGFLKNGGIPHRLYTIACRCEDTIGKPFERRDTQRMGSLNGLI